MNLGPLRMISSENVDRKPLHVRENPLLVPKAQVGVSPDLTVVENTPTDTPKRPRLHANTCGRMRPQADSSGSTSAIAISDLGRKSGPMRTQANLYGRYFLVAEEAL